MRVRYRASDNLPRGVDAALIEGDCESTILLRREATGEDLAEALDEIVGADWVPTSWLYIGNCTEGRDLRAVG